MSKGQVRARGKWGLLLFAAIFLPVLIGLGLWQLNRADEKKLILIAWEQAEESQFLPGSEFEAGLKVRLRGRFDEQMVFLLDNRTRAGRVGYEVLGVFKPEGELKAVLVNLGWVQANPDRRRLPEIDLSADTIEVSGRLVHPQQTLQLRKDVWQSGWPKRIQQIDIERMTEYQPEIFSGVLRLSKPLLDGISPGWPVVTMTPEKHLGYALQWFGLALVLLIGTFWFLRRNP